MIRGTPGFEISKGTGRMLRVRSTPKSTKAARKKS
jgi:hypothetical protein